MDEERNKAVRRDTAFAYRLENGRIAERWAIRDDLAMVQQLGGRPTPKP